MNSSPGRGLLEILRQVPDPRGLQGCRHTLPAMLAALICGLLCGQKSLKAIVDWLHLQPVATCHWLGFFRKPPKRRAFSDLLQELSSEAIETALTQWITGLGVALPD